MKDARTFFVADGYCNSRVVQYIYNISPDERHNVTKINSWGVSEGFGFSLSKSINNYGKESLVVCATIFVALQIHTALMFPMALHLLRTKILSVLLTEKMVEFSALTPKLENL